MLKYTWTTNVEVNTYTTNAEVNTQTTNFEVNTSTTNLKAHFIQVGILTSSSTSLRFTEENEILE